MMSNPSTGIVAARQLPARPNLEHLKNEAKRRLESLRAKTPTVKLAEAQHQLAREYGFANWRELKTQVETSSGVQLSPVERAAVGDWISDAPANTRLALHIRLGDDGALTAAMDSVDYGFFGFAADDVSIEGDRLSFALTTPLVVGFQQGFYQARWDGECERWIGEWTAHGVVTALDFVRGTWPTAPRIEGLDGFWDARVESKDHGLIRLIIRFKTDLHGTYAWLDSPDRNLLGRPAVSISREGRKVTVMMKTVRIEGELSADGQRIEGHLHRGESATPLTFLHRAPGAAPPLPERAPIIELPATALAKFAGRYETQTGVILLVTLEEGRLWLATLGGEVVGSDGQRRVQAPGGPRVDLLPTAPAKFLFRQFDVTAEFELGADGEVTGLVQRQTGLEIRARRLG